MNRLENSVVILVKLNDAVAGYLYGLKDGDSVRIMQNCVAGKYGFYSPVFCGAYDYICSLSGQVSGISVVDFTCGDEPYKLKLAGENMGGQMLLHHFTV